MILQSGYSFFSNFPDYFSRGVDTNPFLFFFWSLFLKSVHYHKDFFLETVQKADKKVDFHFFENITFEKKLPLPKSKFWKSVNKFSGTGIDYPKIDLFLHT